MFVTASLVLAGLNRLVLLLRLIPDGDSLPLRSESSLFLAGRNRLGVSRRASSLQM